MKLKLMAGAALAAMFAAGAAQAEPDGWYGAGDLGYHRPHKAHLHPQFLGSGNVKLQSDWVGFARLGYKFNPHWRLELEGGYRPNKLGDGFAGEAHVWSAMGNVLWDL